MRILIADDHERAYPAPCRLAKVIKELYPNTAILAYSIHQAEEFLNEARRIGLDG